MPENLHLMSAADALSLENKCISLEVLAQAIRMVQIAGKGFPQKAQAIRRFAPCLASIFSLRERPSVTARSAPVESIHGSD